MHLQPQDIVQLTSASVLVEGGDTWCDDVVIDSRAAKKSSLFVAFIGEKTDGNRYVETAFEAGASCCVMSAEPTEEQLAVARAAGAWLLRAEADDGEEFLLRLARGWRLRHPGWLVVGVTGSVGKTTTRTMVARALGARFVTHATSGNFNNLIGAPLTILEATDADEALVVEMGMNHPTEISRIAHAAVPAIGLITNIGTAHIGLLGSREAIARAKGEIVAELAAVDSAAGHIEPTLVLGAGDDFTDFIERTFARPANVKVITVGSSDAATLRYADVTLDEAGVPSATIIYPDGATYPTTLELPGAAMIYDEAAALATAELAGVDRGEAIAAIQSMPATHMRLEIVGGNDKPRIIDDTYNASPSSVAASLDALCAMSCEGRHIAVLGEIGELGSYARELHALIGAYCAAKPLDMLVVIGCEFAPTMREAAITMGMSDDAIVQTDSVEAAVALMRDVLAPGDLVLAKASRAAGLDRFVEGVLV